MIVIVIEKGRDECCAVLCCAVRAVVKLGMKNDPRIR